MKSYSVERARHLVLRAGEGDTLPDDVSRVLRDQGVTCGWIRASGVLVEVELRVFDAAIGGLAKARRIAGPVHALSIEGSVGLDGGEPSMGLHAVLARETDHGMETLAGEIVSARVVALEAFVTAFEDLAIGRALDVRANVVLFGDAANARYRAQEGERLPAVTSLEHVGAWSDSEPARSAARSTPDGDSARSAARSTPETDSVQSAARPTPGAAASSSAASVSSASSAPAVSPSPWSDAIAASAEQEPLRQAASRGAVGGAIPLRPARPLRPQEDSVAPEAGDVVEHFAFGRSEVVKSDGDRLHLRVGKDGRIREIALEMLKVTPLESNGPHRRFKLDRKM